MLLKNFINVGLQALSNGVIKDTTNVNDGAKYFLPPLSALGFDAYNLGTNPNINSMISCLGIVLSSDQQAPNVDDYSVSQSFSSTDLVDVSHSVSSDNGVFTIIQSVRNDGIESVTVNTLGIFGRGSDVNYNFKKVLLSKILLDNPCVINTGETKTFTITIDCNKFVDNTSVSS